MAPENIKINAEEILEEVSKIAATMADVSAPGPVPPPGTGVSPIDMALNAVALAAADKAKDSSSALVKRGTEHNAASQRAVAKLETQEESNAADLRALQAEAARQSAARNA